MSRFGDVCPLGVPMRTLRKVFCILILVVLVTSSAAMAAPADRADDAPSIGSWALSVFDSIASFLLPAEVGGGVEPDEGTDGGFDRGDNPQSLEGGEDPPQEIIGGVDPGG